MAKAGDAYVGRCAAGLRQDTKEFAVLPPEFSPEHSVNVQKQLNAVFPSRKQWPRSFEAVGAHLLAILVFHKQYLQSLPKTHMMWSTYLLRDENALDSLHSFLQPLGYATGESFCIALEFV